MTRHRIARALWVAAAVTFYGGLSLMAGRATRRSMSPYAPMPLVGGLVTAFAVLVLAPAAVLVGHWDRLGVWLGIKAPDLPSGGGPDQHLGAGGSRDERS